MDALLMRHAKKSEFPAAILVIYQLLSCGSLSGGLHVGWACIAHQSRHGRWCQASDANMSIHFSACFGTPAPRRHRLSLQCT